MRLDGRDDHLPPDGLTLQLKGLPYEMEVVNIPTAEALPVVRHDEHRRPHVSVHKLRGLPEHCAVVVHAEEQRATGRLSRGGAHRCERAVDVDVVVVHEAEVVARAESFADLALTVAGVGGVPVFDVLPART